MRVADVATPARPTGVSGGALPSEGRIPFRLRIGVAGHLDIDESDEQLLQAVKREIDRVIGMLPDSTQTPIELAGVSALATGGDRIVAAVVLDREGATLEAVLPYDVDDYAVVQKWSEKERHGFDRYYDDPRTTLKTVLRGSWTKDENRDAAYEAAARYVVRRCDVLIALWDGDHQRGRGGTAPTLLYAAELRKPCIWLSSEDGSRQGDNLEPGTAESFERHVRERAEISPAPPTRGDNPLLLMLDAARTSTQSLVISGELRLRALPLPERWKWALAAGTLGPLCRSFRSLDAFNSAMMPPGTLEGDPADDWAAATYRRAGALAKTHQRRFVWSTRLMAFFATAAAALLGAGLAWDHDDAWPAIGEAVCLVALAAVFLRARFAELHQRWLACRLLAERLRTARYVSQTGARDYFRRLAELESVFVEQQAADWSIRSFEEVWDSRPKGPQRLSADQLERVRRRLCDGWLQEQIDYHERAARRHEVWGWLLATTATLLFVGTVAFAIPHAIDTHDGLPLFGLIALPVAAASLGVILTVRQHHALAERYSHMRRELVTVRGNLQDATTTKSLREAASEAARVIASEAGDWFGAMWFLDVDHPA